MKYTIKKTIEITIKKYDEKCDTKTIDVLKKQGIDNDKTMKKKDPNNYLKSQQ